MSWLEEWFSRLISGFAWMGIIIVFFWLGLIIVLMFQELFSRDDRFRFREYLSRVWKRLLYSYEAVSYGGLIVIPLLIWLREEGFRNYGMVLVASIVLSAAGLYVRRHAGYWPWGKKWLP